MKKQGRIIVLICGAILFGFTLLQGVWLYQFYNASRERLRKDLNLAYEDAVKREFMLRCDTLEKLMLHYLTDTSKIRISSRWSEKFNRTIYRIRSMIDTTDRFELSLQAIDLPISQPLDSVYIETARHLAHSYRKENLEEHTIYYYTQHLGNYANKLVKEWAFDTARLRPLLAAELEKRNASVPFHFYYADKDSLLDQSVLPPGITGRNQVASRSFTTFKQEPGKNYVRAVFDTTPSFIFNRLKWMLLGAVVLLLAISYSFYYLITLLRREKKLSEIKNDFISNITHELKTPVATVSGAIESLTHFDGLADPARTQRYLGIARQELDRLSSLIQEVLQSSLYDQSGLQLRQERFDLLQLIEEVMAAQELAAGSRLHISFNTPGGAVWVTGDRLHLQNALNNVIDNAVKYGGNPVKVMISLDTNEERVTLTVTDNGNGIPEKYLPHIFEKFFRVPQGNRHAVKGYGLGLYYVKQVIEAHRGQCSVISSQQRGTTFTMIIPA